MRLGTLDIIGDLDGCGKLRLTIGHSENPIADTTFRLDADQTERLIIYLKGLRDGMGWNRKAAHDRNL